jgi:hypothetical protein
MVGIDPGQSARAITRQLPGDLSQGVWQPIKHRLFISGKGAWLMVTPNNLEGPVKFFAENRAAHATAVLGAAFSGVLFGVRGVRAQGWQRVGWLALCTLQVVQVIGLFRLRCVANTHATRQAF